MSDELRDGRLTQIGEQFSIKGRLFAKYQCRCGNVIERRVTNVRSGKTMIQLLEIDGREVRKIDRFPNGDGNYELGNCRWATRREQRLNAKNATRLTINGVVKTAFEWAQEPGSVSYMCLLGRLQRGWPHDKAVFLPLQKAGGGRNRWSNQ